MSDAHPAPGEAAGPQAIHAALFPASNALAHKADSRLGLPARLGRKFVKALIRPWLDIQTRYNHAVIRAMQAESLAARARFEELSARLDHALAEIGKLWAESDGRNEAMQGFAGKLQEAKLTCVYHVRVIESRLGERLERLERAEGAPARPRREAA